MLEFKEALQIILDSVSILPDIKEESIANSVGKILAEDIFSDRDYPPFNRAMMDGIACRLSDCNFERPLTIKETIHAGEDKEIKLSLQEVIAIMTGARVPDSCDTVIPKEWISQIESKIIADKIGQIRPLQFIHSQGRDTLSGQLLLKQGTRINSKNIGVLASVGKSIVKIFSPATVSHLATGDEIVSINTRPNRVQIRDINSHLLTELIQRLGHSSISIGRALDNKEDLGEKLSKGLESTVLLISAGVSAGDKDLVPSILKKLKVKEIFHRVNIKPGMPLWFGRGENGQFVFGLPGNPVSTYVCFNLFVKPLLEKLAGKEITGPNFKSGLLSVDFNKGHDRHEFAPIKIIQSNGIIELIPTPHHGSGDFIHFSQCEAVASFSGSKKKFRAGEMIEYLEL